MYNMNSGVYVNYDELSSIIEKLKSERQNLSNILMILRIIQMI